MIDLFSIFTTRLEKAGVPYMVTGSVAGMIYGEPRLTHDVDIVCELDDAAIDRLPSLFPEEEFYCPPIEVMRLEARRPQRGHFNIIEHATGFKADIYLLSREALHRWGLDNRRAIEMDGHTLQVAPPEYVIVRKLQYFAEGRSPKHISDIQGILRHTSDQLDELRLEQLIEQAGVQREWQRIDRGN